LWFHHSMSMYSIVFPPSLHLMCCVPIIQCLLYCVATKLCLLYCVPTMLQRLCCDNTVSSLHLLYFVLDLPGIPVICCNILSRHLCIRLPLYTLS
jgi:hypothetical protein